MKNGRIIWTKKGSWFIVAMWVLLAAVLSIFASTAKDYTNNMNDSGLSDDAASVVAEMKLEKYFPQNEVLPALLVFSSQEALNQWDLKQISDVSAFLSSDQSLESD